MGIGVFFEGDVADITEKICYPSQYGRCISPASSLYLHTEP